jgi:ABC-type branched-subunit amino acid transport system ATPase component
MCLLSGGGTFIVVLRTIRTHCLRGARWSASWGATTPVIALSCAASWPPPRQSRIIYEHREITVQKPPLLCRLGLGYVPDDRRILADLTVGDNLKIAALPPRQGKRPGWTKMAVYEASPAWPASSSRQAGLLSGSEQQLSPSAARS